MILIQETMMCINKSWEILLPICTDWHICASNEIGLSGGLRIIWNPQVFEMQDLLSYVGIILTGHLVGSRHKIHIINTYAPYVGRRKLWENVVGLRFFFFSK